MEPGLTPLIAAALRGADVNELLAGGADVNETKADGATPLFVASCNNHTAVVTALIAANADVNQAKNDGVTPLFISCVHGNTEVAANLLAANAEVNKADNDGATPPTFTQHLVAPPDDDGGLSLTDPRYVTAVDLLGDGGAPLRLDLLVASNNDGYIGWYQNTGAGGKTLPTDCGSCEMLLTSSSSKDPNNDNAKGAMSVKAADFNGDGCLDVLYAGSNLGPAGGPTKIVWELNNCATNPTFVKNVIKGLTAYDGDMFWVEAADLDEDGDAPYEKVLGGDDFARELRALLQTAFERAAR